MTENEFINAVMHMNDYSIQMFPDDESFELVETQLMKVSKIGELNFFILKKSNFTEEFCLLYYGDRIDIGSLCYKTLAVGIFIEQIDDHKSLFLRDSN